MKKIFPFALACKKIPRRPDGLVLNDIWGIPHTPLTLRFGMTGLRNDI
nr:MAG TPA: hypothetical protein [Caudoviricetes sp.]